RRRHTRSKRDWSSDVCSSDLGNQCDAVVAGRHLLSDLSAVLSGLQWRWRRRPAWPHRATAVSVATWRRRGVAVADLSLADGRFRSEVRRLGKVLICSRSMYDV